MYQNQRSHYNHENPNQDGHKKGSLQFTPKQIHGASETNTNINQKK
jgi:hypothetical protein